MSGVGEDSDYIGGRFLRIIDKGLQAIGISRDSAFMRKCHEIEHNRRARIAEQQGDHERAEAERQRARDNITGEYVNHVNSGNNNNNNSNQNQDQK